MKKYIAALGLFAVVGGGGFAFYASRGDVARLTDEQSTGREPVFTAARPESIPTVAIADVAGWQKNDAPVAANGLQVSRFAEGLDHPRSLYRLPNGDILVAETNSPKRTDGGITGMVMRFFMDKAGAGSASANRITLLRDKDGDGVPETRSPFLTGLNSPYGMALIGKTLYVANTDAVLAFPYTDGALKISDKGRKIVNLPHGAPNNHWVRNLLASPDGKYLYVSIGSATNIADEGLEIETNRAAIVEIDLTTGDNRVFASGLRNPVGMAWQPGTSNLWAVVNERDMLGSDLVPDYLTRVEFGAFYGWPWNYWGGYEDKRVEPRRPEVREYTKRPDYALGNHVAPLGLTFTQELKLGAPFDNGAIVGLHGSWNRKPVSGYKVAYIAFGKDLRPTGHPVDLLTGFLTADGKAKGRPVDVMADKAGNLLVSDDVGGIIWKVSRR